jgi:hypothetical protein
MNKQQDESTGEQTKPGLGGEGSYEATERYNERLRKHIQNEDTEKLGKEAKRALEGNEKSELEEAERSAKRGPAPQPKPAHGQR